MKIIEIKDKRVSTLKADWHVIRYSILREHREAVKIPFVRTISISMMLF